MNNGNVTFKAYTMEQPRLLPPDLGELIPEDHLVRVVEAIDPDASCMRMKEDRGAEKP